MYSYFNNVIYSDNIVGNSRLKNDNKLLEQDRKDNKKSSDYLLIDFRPYCKNDFVNDTINKKGEIPLNYNVYAGTGINQCDIDNDSELRPTFTNKPDDKNTSKLNEKRKYDYISEDTFKTNDFDSGFSNINPNGICQYSFSDNKCDFLTQTTIGPNPQQGYNPLFDIAGLNTHDLYRKHYEKK